MIKYKNAGHHLQNLIYQSSQAFRVDAHKVRKTAASPKVQNGTERVDFFNLFCLVASNVKMRSSMMEMSKLLNDIFLEFQDSTQGQCRYL